MWEGRFKSCIVKESNYVLGCYRYIELNPVRAGMVAHPAEYMWSSYRVNAEGESDKLITPQCCYIGLGSVDEERRRAYRSLFKSELSANLIGQVRTATNANYALGSDRFRHEVESALGRRAGPGRSGRPGVS